MIYRDRENGVTLFKLLSNWFMRLWPEDNVLTSEINFVRNKLEIHCSQDGEKINMNIEVRNIILDLKRLEKTNGKISKTLSEVYGYSVTEMVCTNSSEELTVGAKRGYKEHGIYRRPQKSVELVDVTEQ